MAGDPANDLVIHDVDSLAAAEGLIAHADQLDAMERAGAKAGPRTAFCD